MASAFDAIVVGAGPNGLSAAVELAREGLGVLVLEAEATIGGGARTSEVTLPDFRHDVCSAIHPMAVLSPAFRRHELAIDWIEPDIALAHPLEGGDAALVRRDVGATAEGFGTEDAFMWRALHERRLAAGADFWDDVLRPIRIPRRPLAMARFGLLAVQSASRVANRWFRGERARVSFAGCAAHAMVPLERAGTAAFASTLLLAAHATGWPIPRGGSGAIPDALAARLCSFGGEIRTSTPVRSLRELPPSKIVLFDVMPAQLAQIAGDALPASYAARLGRYRHGPGVFKIDYALAGPIPWTNEGCRRAGTVHLGPRLADIARAEKQVADGEHPEAPFVLIAQQSLFDPSRAPEGKHTGWAYCHVPNGSTVDMTARIEAQIERFAPGFGDLVLARRTLNTRELAAHDRSFVGGDIGGGANDLAQVLARPLVRWDPYATPNPQIFLCSSATPPGGGVHGMCGSLAARSALRSIGKSSRRAA